MMRTIFLSHYLNEKTPGYGGSSGFKVRHVSKIIEGASSNSQEWILSNHIGTHIDLSAHFDDRGKRMNEFIADDWVFFSPYLLKLDPRPGQILTPCEEFHKIPLQTDFLIIKTDFQRHRGTELYWQNNPGLSPELAQWLRKERPNVKCLGFDFISITAYSNRPLGRIAHKSFLGVEEGSVALRVIEDMKLDELEKHPLKVVVAPLLVENADGAPVTVVAFL